MIWTRILKHPVVVAMLLVSAVWTLSGPVAASSPPRLEVVAAENFWGSIAAQLGGDRVHVDSIITNPSADPHEYEPTPRDAELVATADLLVVNGLGYDAWASSLGGAKLVLNVGNVLRLKDGDNPHRWYNPTDVRKVISMVTSDLGQLDSRDKSYFKTRERQFETSSLATLNGLLRQIHNQYKGTKVGASESIFSMLAPALGLNLITPYSFLKAISEGTEPTARDIETIDAQIAKREIAVYVYNSQNATPDIQRQIAACRSRGIPVTTITETLVPTSATYEAWQVSELRGLLNALAKARGH